MKKGKFICRAAALGMTLGICFSMAAFANVQNETSKTVLSALPVKALDPKQLEENPYIAKSDSNVHNDGYNTDTTDEVLPLGIYPEVHTAYETVNGIASPAIFFDSYGHAGTDAWWHCHPGYQFKTNNNFGILFSCRT